MQQIDIKVKYNVHVSDDMMMVAWSTETGNHFNNIIV
jgi:hypothetical protein